MAETKTHKQAWYNLSTEQVIADLGSARAGISEHEAKERLKHFGPNAIAPKRRSFFRLVIEPFTNVFMVILLFAIAISLFSHERLDASIIGLVVAMNAILYYLQQFSVNRVLRSLEAHEDNMVSVIRDGKTGELPAHLLVPGDVLHVFEGMKIPADGRLIETEGLSVDESILTGESLPQHKITDSLHGDKEVFDQTNMVFKGTIVHGGMGLMVVCTTGNATQLGIIGKLAGSSDEHRTPIEKKIDDIARKIIIGVGIIGVAVFVLAMLRGIELAESLRFTLSLVVSVVPEGLPVTLTIVLLLSAKKMATHKALVKKLSSIETMGAITLIATDKTGTLTQNKLAVAAVSSDTQQLAQTAELSINKQRGAYFDPLDEILAANFHGKHKGHQLHHTFAFDQGLRLSGASYKLSNGQHLAYLKGAPEAILDIVPTSQGKAAEKLLRAYTQKGYRTIAFAHTAIPATTRTLAEVAKHKFTLDGLIALADPMRKNIPAAIRQARAAGIQVVMLTGDNKETAAEIARQAGLIQSSSQVADSKLLDKPASPKIIRTLLERIRVFGRVLPRHKFNFLKSVKQQEVTAMTGDGVNDIPALVEADAGLAMGSGTDAAKEASDIVLLDDNFSTIIDAIRLGRAVVANIRKMLSYLITTSLAEAGTMIGALLLGLPLPVTAVQILWINLVTDSFTVLPIGLGNSEKHQMQQPPRDPKAPLLSSTLLSRTIFMGAVTALLILGIFSYSLHHIGYEEAQTAAFIALVIAQWSNALNANFDRHSWVRNFTHPNYKLLLGIAVSVIFQAVALYGPLRNAFGITALPANILGAVIVLPIIVILIAGDLHKLLFRDKVKPVAK
ncbi:cation-transporting P-type ATPase [Candidatus Saccharibacteria bacterium]|nr:cation-transporting P-type ATPase [Candidatus Saccharibacteria bacterium]